MTSNLKFYFTILELLKEGKNPNDISKELNISKQKISYYTKKLKEFGFIKKKGYGTWEVLRSKKEDLEHTLNWRDKKIRGHAFIWVIRTKKFNWKEILENKKISYNLVRGYTPRIIIRGRKIWLGKDSIAIYEIKSFYGKNAIQSRKYAVYELSTILEVLEKKLGISLGKYRFKAVKEHYGMIKNELAQQINKKGEKIIVRDDLDGEWLWIDDSDSLGELETGGKGITKDRAGLNLEVQKWWNDNKEHNFKVTPSFLLESINQVTQNQVVFDKNIKKHQKVLDEMLKTLKMIRKEINKRNESKALS